MVLAGVDEQLLVALAQGPRDGRGLDELGPVADDGEDAHRRSLRPGGGGFSSPGIPFGISLTGIKKHVRVLEEVELVRTEKVGRSRRCSLGPRGLEEASGWIETYRRTLEGRLDRLGEFLQETKGEQR